MEKIYNLTVDEIMESVVKPSEGGFDEAEIRAAEQRLGVSLPECYRDYLKKYGKDEINQKYNQLFAPHEIFKSYDRLERDIESFLEYIPEDELAARMYAPYYQLYKKTRDEWHSVTENYVIIWCENQGVWNAGYLLSDLQNGVENPPVYITIDDDLVSFSKCSENTENFLNSMLCQALHEFNSGCFASVEEINRVLNENGIDKSKMHCKVADTTYRGNCLDKASGRFYMYHSYNGDGNLTIVDLENTK